MTRLTPVPGLSWRSHRPGLATARTSPVTRAVSDPPYHYPAFRRWTEQRRLGQGQWGTVDSVVDQQGRTWVEKTTVLAPPRTWDALRWTPAWWFPRTVAPAWLRQGWHVVPVVDSRLTTTKHLQLLHEVSPLIPQAQTWYQWMLQPSRSHVVAQKLWFQLAQLLRQFHRHGFTHGDLHGENLLIESPHHRPELWLIDYDYVQYAAPWEEFRRDVINFMELALHSSLPLLYLELARREPHAGWERAEVRGLEHQRVLRLAHSQGFLTSIGLTEPELAYLWFQVHDPGAFLYLFLGPRRWEDPTWRTLAPRLVKCRLCPGLTLALLKQWCQWASEALHRAQASAYPGQVLMDFWRQVGATLAPAPATTHPEKP